MFIRYATIPHGIKEISPKEAMTRLAKRYDKRTIDSIDKDKYLFFLGTGIVANGKANDNGDAFMFDEVMKETPYGKPVWSTWINKPLLENHEPMERRGQVKDSTPVKRTFSLDFLNALDKTKHPILARRIQDGIITDTSMGLVCEYGECSYCGNKAYEEEEWCPHVEGFKGREMNGQLVFELNYGLEGMENSLITTGAGAEPMSKIREILSQKWGVTSQTDIDNIDRMIMAHYRGFCKKKNVDPEDFAQYIFAKLGVDNRR
jgi:hypothetical protein